jgi:hypothetical protein
MSRIQQILDTDIQFFFAFLAAVFFANSAVKALPEVREEKAAEVPKPKAPACANHPRCHGDTTRFSALTKL